PPISSLFSFHDSPTTVFYTLSLHDALPISCIETLSAFVQLASVFVSATVPRRNRHGGGGRSMARSRKLAAGSYATRLRQSHWRRSEEHTSELQSRGHLVCRLLLEKKKTSKQ